MFTFINHMNREKFNETLPEKEDFQSHLTWEISLIQIAHLKEFTKILK